MNRWLLSAIALLSALPVTANAAEWNALAPLPEGRMLPSVAVIDGTLVVAGGSVSDIPDASAATFVYDIVSGAWSSASDMPTARMAALSAAHHGELFVIGGITNSGAEVQAVESYDPVTDSWTAHPPLPVTSTTEWAFAASDGEVIYLYTDTTFTSNDPAGIYTYDPASESWTFVAPRHPGEWFYGMTGAFVDGRMYLLGGVHNDPPATDVRVFDINTKEWTSAASIPAERVFATAVVVHGKIHLIGGADHWSTYNGFDTVDVYTPSTDTWSMGEPLLVPRFAAGAATDGGRIFEVGGAADESGWTQGEATLFTLDLTSDEVCICHYPPGNPDNARTICVGEPAVDAHLRRHGDTLGPCAF